MDRERRRARLDELRQIREEIARSGGFKAQAPTDPRGMAAEAWMERAQGGDAPGSMAGGGRWRERLGSRGQGGDRPILRMLMERRGAGSAPGGGRGAGGGTRPGDLDPQARRERLQRLLGRFDRGDRDK